MYPVTSVSSHAELHDVVAQLPATSANNIRVFRGQYRHHGTLIPSRWRAEHKYVPFDDAWIYASFRIIKEKFLKIDPAARLGELTGETLVYTEALIQHYGIRSSYLDVTRHLETALWFATRTAIHETWRLDVLTDPSRKDRVQNVLIPKAWYVPSEEPTGFVYVMDCEVWSGSGNPKHGQLVGLQALLPSVPAARVKQQEGDLVVSNYDAARYGDLSSCVVAAFRIEQPRMWIEAEPNPYNTLDMFPLPASDPIYAALLRSYLVFQKKEGVWKKTLGIPEYHSSAATILAGPESDAYCNLLVFTEPADYFLKLLRHPDPFEALEINKHKFQFKDAFLIALQRPMWFIRMIPRDDPSYQDAPPTTEIAGHLPAADLNIFIELSILELVRPDDPSAPVLRGIWFVKSGRHFAISRWYRSRDGYPHTEPWLFQLNATTGDFKEAPENQQDDDWMPKELRLRELQKALRVVWQALASESRGVTIVNVG